VESLTSRENNGRNERVCLRGGFEKGQPRQGAVQGVFPKKGGVPQKPGAKKRIAPRETIIQGTAAKRKDSRREGFKASSPNGFDCKKKRAPFLWGSPLILGEKRKENRHVGRGVEEKSNVTGKKRTPQTEINLLLFDLGGKRRDETGKKTIRPYKNTTRGKNPT